MTLEESVSHWKTGGIISHLFSPIRKALKLASSAITLVGVFSELKDGNAFEEDEGDEISGLKETL